MKGPRDAPAPRRALAAAIGATTQAPVPTIERPKIRLSLAQAFALEMGAEGVETSGELEKLRLLGCDFAQGYYWQEPIPAEEVEKLLTGSLDS
jgi:sensor c-di-GMP phosphodiesterase-like protein